MLRLACTLSCSKPLKSRIRYSILCQTQHVDVPHQADVGNECDCAMQGHCFCDATCDCNGSISRQKRNALNDSFFLLFF